MSPSPFPRHCGRFASRGDGFGGCFVSCDDGYTSGGEGGDVERLHNTVAIRADTTFLAVVLCEPPGYENIG
jgi:hypothetical protein